MKANKRIAVFGLLGAVVVAALLFQNWQQRHHTLAEGLIFANGRIEGNSVTVASKYPGKVTDLLAEEGQSVVAGEILLNLSDDEIRTKLRQAEAAMETLKLQRNAGETGLRWLKQNQPVKIQLAEAGVEHAQSLLRKAQSAEQHAREDADRFTQLAAQGSIEKHHAQEMDLRWQLAQSDLAVALTGVKIALGQLAQAQFSNQEIEVKEDNIRAIGAQIEQAQAACDEIKCVLTSLSVRAPEAGVITQRIAQLGEVVIPGSPLFEIVDLNALYLKVYIAEKYLGKIRRGLKARIYIDAFPNQYYEATVGYIASQAEFTPKEVQTADERVKMVYAVKLFMTENPAGQLTPGMPADAVIRWDESVPWQKPSW